MEIVIIRSRIHTEHDAVAFSGCGRGERGFGDGERDVEGGPGCAAVGGRFDAGDVDYGMRHCVKWANPVGGKARQAAERLVSRVSQMSKANKAQWAKWGQPAKAPQKKEQSATAPSGLQTATGRPFPTPPSTLPSVSFTPKDPRWKELQDSFTDPASKPSLPSSSPAKVAPTRIPITAPPTGYLDLSSISQASMDSPIPSTNPGFRLLLKMGWKEGTGLGRTFEGRVDPIRIEVKEDFLGLGKQSELDYYHESSTAARRELTSEIIARETDEQRLAREAEASKRELIKQEIRDVTRAFFCELCGKGYAKVSEWENHESSYDHHHRKRLAELKEHTRKMIPDEEKKRKREEKEREREERELKRLMGIVEKKGANSGAPGQSASAVAPVTEGFEKSTADGLNSTVDSAGRTIGTSGWTTVPPEPAQQSGWNTVPEPQRTSGWTTVSSEPIAQPNGWSAVHSVETKDIEASNQMDRGWAEPNQPPNNSSKLIAPIKPMKFSLLGK